MKNPDRFNPDLEEFKKNYYSMSRKELREHYEVLDATIVRVLAQNNIPLKPGRSQEEKDEIYKENRKRYRAQRQEKIKNDPALQMRHYATHAINEACKSNGVIKPKGIWDHLPYSYEDLKNHLESHFEPWMTWENRGNAIKDGPKKWNIDHIIPQSKLTFTSVEDDNFKRCWALSNLRPICSVENSIKGDQDLELPEVDVSIEMKEVNKMGSVAKIKLSKEEFVAQLKEVGSGRALARKMDISFHTVWKFAKKHNLELKELWEEYKKENVPYSCRGCDKEKLHDQFEFIDYNSRKRPICIECRNTVKSTAKDNASAKRKIPIVQINTNLGQLIVRAVRAKGNIDVPVGAWQKYLKFTPKELWNHIENQFQNWMTPENYAIRDGQSWCVSHKVILEQLPFESETDDNFAKYWALENLYPEDRKINAAKHVHVGYKKNGVKNKLLKEIDG